MSKAGFGSKEQAQGETLEPSQLSVRTHLRHSLATAETFQSGSF